MNNYLSDLGHWERINVSANSVVADPQKLNLPVIVQDACRALIDIHDALTSRPCDCARHDAYAAREAEQREAAEPDPLDENDHRDRVDSDGGTWRMSECGYWHLDGAPRPTECPCWQTLARVDATCGPLTFAPEAAPQATGDDPSAPEGESGPEEGPDTDDAPEPLLCSKCGHDG